MNWIVLALLLAVLLMQLLIYRRLSNDKQTENRDELRQAFERIERNFREDFKLNRLESREIAKDNREELTATLKDFQLSLEKSIQSFNNIQREKFSDLKEEQQRLVSNTEKRLEEIRLTVEEKLQKTLNERISQSFKIVNEQLENVQKGLGEMQALAQDVGGLKKVLSNVKTRGNIGEIQLGMLLEQMLAPEQYDANVKTKKGSEALVEYAVKLPGKDDTLDTVYLPIDAKFPKDVYEQLLDAYDTNDPQQIDTAGKLLENTIRKMAKDISDKYLDPPFTTEFGIMFLPFESIYAEVVRRSTLLEDLQRNYHVVVTGPTTLAAILNSLQMGFRTLAVQRYSGEVWKILGAVKKEFEQMGGMLEKAKKHIETANNQIDNVLGVRTRAIQRRLKDVDALDAQEARRIIPEIGPLEDDPTS
ncbi:MAG TPA: DNA recombination protein RmuC [Parabacteroides sp.]|nr:DNA recombination protein RmuC [Parabacteroides sp.]